MSEKLPQGTTRGTAAEVMAKVDQAHERAQKAQELEAELALLSEEIDGDFDIALSIIASGAETSHVSDCGNDGIEAVFHRVRDARAAKDSYKLDCLFDLRNDLEGNL